MEEPQTQSPVQKLPKKSRKRIKGLLYGLLGLIFVIACAYGVYVWQKNESEGEKRELQSQINSLKKSNEPIAAEPERVTYRSKVGGLTLSLPAPYVVIVSVDGNKGGAPGSTLRIGKESSDGIIQDNVYEWVEIEISRTSSSLDRAVQILSTQLTEANFENIVVRDIKVKSDPAKLITARGFSYEGSRRIYLINSGEFTYQFTSKTLQDIAKNNEMFEAVLDGVVIEEKVLDS